MSIRVATGSGDVPVICWGLFTVQIGQLEVLFALNDCPANTGLEITDYRSGMRWPTMAYREPCGAKLGLTSPPDYSDPVLQRVIRKAKDQIAADIQVRGLAVVEDVIPKMWKRYKTNEWDF